MPKTSAKQPKEESVSEKHKLLHILHVDDDAYFRKSAKQILEMHGSFKVDDASSVNEALEKMEQKAYDAVISDYQMAKVDGLDFLRKLRAKGDKITFILFTGKGREEVAINALNLGADGYINKLGKPETVYGELTHYILQSVERKKSERALIDSEKKFRTLVEHTGVGIVVIQNRKVVFYNNYIHEMLGYTEAEYSKLDFRATIHPEDRELAIERIRQRITSKLPSAKGLHLRLLTKSGEIRHVESTSFNIEWENKPALMAYIIDINNQNSENRFRELSDLLPEIVFETDVTGRLTYVNQAGFDSFGYSQEEFEKGLNTIQIIAAKDRGRAKVNIGRVLKGEKVGPTEYTAVKKDGNTFPIKIHSAPIIRENKPVGIRGIILDITKRKQTEEKIRESEEKYRHLFDSSPDGIVLIDNKGVITSVNEAIQQWTGFTKDDLLGKHFTEAPVLQAKDIPKYAKIIKSAINGKKPSAFEVVYVRRDGSQRLAEALISLVIERNKAAGVQILVRDITERKLAEKEIQELAKFPSENPDPVLRISKDGKIIYANRVAREHECEEVPEELQKAVKNSLRSGINGEIEIKCGNQTFSFIITPIPDKGYANVYGRNVTEANAAWESLDESINALVQINEKLDVVGRLTRHDARNKLSVVLNDIYLAKTHMEDNQKSLKYLQNVEKTVEQIEDLFGFAAAYNKLGVEELTYLSVKKHFNEATVLLSRSKDFEFTVECSGLIVLADSLLRQLFYNLIHNSIVHSQKADQILLQCQEEENQLKIIYEDNGVGISRKEKEKIFEEGYGKGTGYGLYLIRKICEAYGWTIQETGVRGKGALFVMTIPKTTKKGEIAYRFESQQP